MDLIVLIFALMAADLATYGIGYGVGYRFLHAAQRA
jgi:hypothetical protein